jgi:alpha-galactosidase
MVNPASDLYQEHPEWAIHQPHRELEYYRNQLALDLSRPEVREFSWKVVDDTLGPNPGIVYVKWDANRHITQPGSTHLPPEEQTHLLIDYNFALYDIMGRMMQKYPQVMTMVCAGGGGRVDYGSMQFFHSFWPSDNTDPRSRVFIQWGFSHIFPSPAISAHVTRMGNRPLKFAMDVALSGAYGVDMDVRRLNADERRAIASASATYRERLQQVVLQGDLYRLESPYERPRAALNYVSGDKARAALFVYQLASSGAEPVKVGGLDAQRRYRVRELNLPAGATSQLAQHDQVIAGQVFMTQGLVPPCRSEFDSAVIELVAE